MRYPREPMASDDPRLDRLTQSDLVLMRHLEGVQRPWTAAELAWYQLAIGFTGSKEVTPG